MYLLYYDINVNANTFLLILITFSPCCPVKLESKISIVSVYKHICLYICKPIAEIMLLSSSNQDKDKSEDEKVEREPNPENYFNISKCIYCNEN